VSAPLSRWLWRVLSATVIAATLVVLSLAMARSDGYRRYREMRVKLGELVGGNEALRRENQALRHEIVHLRDDLDAIATVARDELGLVDPGEVVIQIERGPAPAGGQP
jgi:cell division protein FtsB